MTDTPQTCPPVSHRAALVGAVPRAPSCVPGSGSTAASPGAGRGGRPCGSGADHRHPGQHLHPPLPPGTLCLPHLVGGCLPGCHQPLWPLLPPVPGSLLTGGSWDVPVGTVGAQLLVPLPLPWLLFPLCTCWWHLWTCTWGQLCHQPWARGGLWLLGQHGHCLLLPPITTVPLAPPSPLPLPGPTW